MKKTVDRTLLVTVVIICGHAAAPAWSGEAPPPKLSAVNLSWLAGAHCLNMMGMLEAAT